MLARGCSVDPVKESAVLMGNQHWNSMTKSNGATPEGKTGLVRHNQVRHDLVQESIRSASDSPT